MSVNVKFDKATYLSLIFKFILSEGLSNNRMICFTIPKTHKSSTHLVL